MIVETNSKRNIHDLFLLDFVALMKKYDASMLLLFDDDGRTSVQTQIGQFEMFETVAPVELEINAYLDIVDHLSTHNVPVPEKC